MEALSKSKEFEDITLRVNEKKILNTLNKDKHRATIRYWKHSLNYRLTLNSNTATSYCKAFNLWYFIIDKDFRLFIIDILCLENISTSFYRTSECSFILDIICKYIFSCNIILFMQCAFDEWRNINAFYYYYYYHALIKVTLTCQKDGLEADLETLS